MSIAGKNPEPKDQTPPPVDPGAPDDGGGNPPAPTASVTAEEYQAALKKAQAYEAKLKEYEKKQKDAELDQAKKNNEWQRIAELKEKEAEDALANLSKMRESVVSDKKMSTIRERAIAAGLRPESIEDLGLIDFPEVTIETGPNGSSLKVVGAEKAVQRLKTLRPHWFQDGAPRVNSSTPSANRTNSKITLADLDAAEKEAKKTGDIAAYKAKVLAFKTQNS